MVIGDSGDPGTNAPRVVEVEHRHAEEPAITLLQTMGGTTALGNPFKLRVVIQNAVRSMHHGVHGAPILFAPINPIPVVGANSPVLGAAQVQAAVEVLDVLELHLHKQETAI